MPTPAELSVVVCTRERPELLRNALSTIVACTPGEADILVVDSASTTAATRDVAAAAGVRYVRTDVKGLSIARNVGLTATDRAFVVYTDDDCEATEGWTAALLADFEEPGVGAVTGLMRDHLDVEGAPHPAPRILTRTIDGLDAGHGALMAFPRELLERLGGFDEALGAGRRFAGAEDLDMFCRVLDAGCSVVVEPRSIVRHVNTREDQAYAELYRGYGLGLGAMAAKWLRMRPGTGSWLLALLVGRALRRTVSTRADRRRSRAERAMLAGVLGGVVEALAIPVRDGRLVDRRPPDPIVLTAPSEEAS